MLNESNCEIYCHYSCTASQDDKEPQLSFLEGTALECFVEYFYSEIYIFIHILNFENKKAFVACSNSTMCFN